MNTFVPKRKILYIITKSNWGGAQRYVFDLAINLPKDRFDLVVAAGGNGPLIQKLRAADIRVIPMTHFQRDINPLKELYAIYGLWRILKNERPDVVHLNSTKAGLLGAIAAFIYKITSNKLELVTSNRLLVIFTVHGWGFHEDRPRWQKAAIFFSSWLSARLQHAIIHVAKSDYDKTLSLRIASEPVARYIPLGIHQKSQSHSRNTAREFFANKLQRTIGPNTVLIGTIAELTKNKGLSHLLDAIKQMECQMPNIKYQTVIIGDGEDRGKLQDKINTLGLKNTVRLVGFISDAARLLKGFDLFVLPSLKEGSPYTIIEAMLAETPIVATNVGGIPELIEDNKTGRLVPPADSLALADAITNLLENAERRKTFCINAAKKIRTSPSFSNMIQKTIELYNS